MIAALPSYSEAGSLLTRGPVIVSVWAKNRLDLCLWGNSWQRREIADRWSLPRLRRDSRWHSFLVVSSSRRQIEFVEEFCGVAKTADEDVRRSYATAKRSTVRLIRRDGCQAIWNFFLSPPRTWLVTCCHCRCRHHCQAAKHGSLRAKTFVRRLERTGSAAKGA